MTYRFLSPAQRDLAEAVEYYDRAAPGLGLEFLDEIERTVERVLLHPEAWTRVSEYHRRCRTRRFPSPQGYALGPSNVFSYFPAFLREHSVTQVPRPNKAS